MTLGFVLEHRRAPESGQREILVVEDLSHPEYYLEQQPGSLILCGTCHVPVTPLTRILYESVSSSLHIDATKWTTDAGFIH